jgi:hypothetical protein
MLVPWDDKGENLKNDYFYSKIAKFVAYGIKFVAHGIEFVTHGFHIPQIEFHVPQNPPLCPTKFVAHEFIYHKWQHGTKTIYHKNIYLRYL